MPTPGSRIDPKWKVDAMIEAAENLGDLIYAMGDDFPQAYRERAYAMVEDIYAAETDLSNNWRRTITPADEPLLD